MRDFKGMKRQRGRNRGGGGGGKPQHNANRSFESNGPDGVKVRGAAQSIFERYQQLARDATSAGDRVLAENYLQHAEHYFRTLRAMQPHRPVSEILGRDQVSSGFDIDFEAEPGEAPAEENTEASDDGGEGNNDGGDQQQRQQRDRYENRNRDDRQQGEGRNRDDRPRDGQQQADRQQGEGRNNRNNRDRWRDRDDRQRGDQPREQSETPAPVAAEPPKDAPVLRSEDGEVSHAPAFLGRAPEPRPEGAESAPPRRRRRKSEGTAAPETEEA